MIPTITTSSTKCCRCGFIIDSAISYWLNSTGTICEDCFDYIQQVQKAKLPQIVDKENYSLEINEKPQ